MNDGPAMALLVLFGCVVGIVIGGSLEAAKTVSDCDALHAFKVGDAVYDCRKRGADADPT